VRTHDGGIERTYFHVIHQAILQDEDRIQSEKDLGFHVGIVISTKSIDGLCARVRKNDKVRRVDDHTPMNQLMV
jgi:hypothetical protein